MVWLSLIETSLLYNIMDWVGAGTDGIGIVVVGALDGVDGADLAWDDAVDDDDELRSVLLLLLLLLSFPTPLISRLSVVVAGVALAWSGATSDIVGLDVVMLMEDVASSC